MGRWSAVAPLLMLCAATATAAAPLTSAGSVPPRVVQLRTNQTLIPSTPYNERWMENLMPIIANRTLLDLTLPGTHDSGAYVLFEEIIAGPGLQRLIDRAEELGIPVYDLIDGWSICQTRTFYEQLAGGIRSLDMRAAWDGSEWRTVHGLLGVSIQTLLDDIRLFMETHTSEIVHVLIGNLAIDGRLPSPPLRQRLLDQIERSLGSFMIPRTPDLILGDTIAELVRRNHRVLMIHPIPSDISDRPLFWPTQNFTEGQYSNENELENMVTYNKNLTATLGGSELLFTMSWTLTPRVEDIVRGLPPSAEIRTLYEMVRPANDYLDTFFRETTQYRLGHVLIVDFFEETNLVEVAKAWNRRDCNDVAEYRARNENGTDCRSGAERGRCQAEPVFMSRNCPLSCGLCGNALLGEPSQPCARSTDCISGFCGAKMYCLTDDPLPTGASCGVDNQCASSTCAVESKLCL